MSTSTTISTTLEADHSVDHQEVEGQAPVAMEAGHHTLDLTDKDRAKLEKLEAKVKNSVAEGWKALAEIQHYEAGKLWKSQFTTFEDYVESRFDFHRKHSARLVEAGRFLLLLDKSKSKVPHPTRESHIREITQKLPEKHRVGFWDKFCEERAITENTLKEITAKDIKSAVKEYRKDVPQDELPPKAVRAPKAEATQDELVAKAITLIARVKLLIEEHPEKDHIVTKLEEINTLLQS